jgi:uncharacterized protein with von Willebrand factor type A (vWA) domain
VVSNDLLAHLDSPILIVDRSLPAEHQVGPGRISTAACDLVLATTEELLARMGRTDTPLITYDERSRWSTLRELRAQRWAYIYGTNLQHALELARVAVDRPDRLLLIGHSRPSAHLTATGEPLINIPPNQQTDVATAAEIDDCARLGLEIHLVVVPPEPAIEILPWAAAIVTALDRTGGSFTQASEADDLDQWIDDHA